MMKCEEALQILNQIVASVPMSRADHQRASIAVETLNHRIRNSEMKTPAGSPPPSVEGTPKVQQFDVGKLKQ